MTKNDIIKVEKEQPNGSFMNEDSYALTIGTDDYNVTIGELSKYDLVKIKEEIEKILESEN